MATLYSAEHVHVAQTQSQIPTAYFCVGQESESKSILESVCGNVSEPLVNENVGFLTMKLHGRLNSN